MTRNIVVTPENMDELSAKMHSFAMEHMRIQPGTIEEKIFLALAFAGEAGELANIVKKMWRDGYSLELVQQAKMEIADNLLYLDHLLGAFGTTAEEVKCAKLDELYNVRGAQWAQGAVDDVLAHQEFRVADNNPGSITEGK